MTTWDEDKRERNSAKHGVDLVLAGNFEMHVSLVDEDTTEVYGEQRFRAIGPIGNTLYVYIYTWNTGATEQHTISLRRAEPRERRYCAKNI